ncbi:hypothetical protein [Actinomadura madurae]|uniref:hypothetical protein n=1 Tax=Actinomadura madurae TaxID=1993 RepID=UPI0020D1FA71|nr:hypothetical protein [Actinomadura madurae]MCQ0004802.1 hypothetical protein [Actinomadura madurae]
MTLARPPAGDRAPVPAPAGGTGTADTARAALARARAARAAELDRWLADLLAAAPSRTASPSWRSAATPAAS